MNHNIYINFHRLRFSKKWVMFGITQIRTVLGYLKGGPNLLIWALVMFLHGVFRQERFNRSLWFLASLRKCYLFSCKNKNVWDIGIYLKPHFYKKYQNLFGKVSILLQECDDKFKKLEQITKYKGFQCSWKINVIEDWSWRLYFSSKTENCDAKNCWEFFIDVIFWTNTN